MGFETLIKGDKNVVIRRAEGAVALGFLADVADLKVGQAVMLKNAVGVSKVAPVASANDLPLGVIVTPQEGDSLEVVVLPFGGSTELLGQADRTVEGGDRVSASGFDAVTGLTTYKSGGKFVCGVALSGADGGGEIRIMALNPSTR